MVELVKVDIAGHHGLHNGHIQLQAGWYGVDVLLGQRPSNTFHR